MPIATIEANQGCKPIKIWTKDIEEGALDQLRNLSTLPFIHKHVAAMPDVHWGMGATVGSVIATKKALIPAAVGVDIGCGMIAQKLSLRAEDLPDNLAGLRSAIESAVPHGRTNNGRNGDRGAWGNPPAEITTDWLYLADDPRFKELAEREPKALSGNVNTIKHLGTLGTGNHFIEVCLDTEGNVWVMLHSGSRGIGNRLGSYFIDRAKEEMERWSIKLPDPDLAYLPESTELFKSYWSALSWAQDFALVNRHIMMSRTLRAIEDTILPKNFEVLENAINCHHNYATKENHFGENVFVTRKGAIRAREGDLGIIPGSMGARSFIVRGKGNPESFCSCSHGAGRRMGRNEAKRQFTTADLVAQTSGVECRKDADVIDEIPSAYKPIDGVMANQTDLVEVVAELKQLLCVKG